MRIFTRHIIFELLKIFLLILTGMTLLIFIALMGKEAVDKGLGLGPLLRMVPYLVPQAMQFAVPGTMLLATTSVYGRLSGFNEIVAVKSLGISPFALIWPTLVLATLVSFGAVLLNDLAVSWGHQGVQRVFLDSLEEVAYGQLRMHRSYTSGNLKITVRRVDGDRLVQPTLVVQSSGSGPALTVTAEEANLKAYPDEDRLVVTFRDFEVNGPVTIKNPDTYQHVISLAELTGSSAAHRSPSNFALGEIPQAKVEQVNQIKSLKQEAAANTAFDLLTGRFDRFSESSHKRLEARLASANYRLQRFKTEPYRRWANGFSCLCFVAIGAPMAIRLRHAEFLASFFACFLPILIVYYPLLMVSLDKAKGGAIPPQAVWIGNLVLALWGAWLTRRVIRY